MFLSIVNKFLSLYIFLTYQKIYRINHSIIDINISSNFFKIIFLSLFKHQTLNSVFYAFFGQFLNITKIIHRNIRYRIRLSYKLHIVQHIIVFSSLLRKFLPVCNKLWKSYLSLLFSKIQRFKIYIILKIKKFPLLGTIYYVTYKIR